MDCVGIHIIRQVDAHLYTGNYKMILAKIQYGKYCRKCNIMELLQWYKILQV